MRDEKNTTQKATTYSKRFKTGVVATGWDADRNVWCGEFAGAPDMAGLTSHVDGRYPGAVQIQAFISGVMDIVYVKDGAGHWIAKRLKAQVQA
jgi:hypothetical protein